MSVSRKKKVESVVLDLFTAVPGPIIALGPVVTVGPGRSIPVTPAQ